MAKKKVVKMLENLRRWSEYIPEDGQKLFESKVNEIIELVK